MNIYRPSAKSAIAVAIAASISSTAFAQTSVPSTTLEEVLITAQKRAQSANDVGIALTALGETQIEDFRIRTAADLVAITPNLDYKTTNGGLNPAITIRGVGMNDFNVNSSAGVGVYVDEVYLTSTAMLTSVNFDMERVEILKGPQGTLYGRNSNGGAINFISKRPAFESDAYIQVGAGNFGLKEMEGAVGGGLSDSVAGRVSVRYSDRDGSQEWIQGDKELGELESSTIRGQLLFQGDALDVNLSVTMSEDEGSTTAAESLGAFDPVTFDPCSDARINNYECADFTGYVPSTNQDPYKVNLGQRDIDAISDMDNEYDLANLSINYDIGDLTFSSVTSHLNMDRTWGEGTVDHDPALASFITINKDESITQTTQEFRLSGYSDIYDWVVGAYYSTDEVETDNVLDALGFIEGAVGMAFPGETVQVPWQYKQETTVAALFGHMEYFMTDEWKLVVGLRYSDEERDFVGSTQLIDSLGAVIGTVEDGLVLAAADTSISDSMPSGKLGVEYFPNEDWLIYGSVSTGFKSGGISGDFAFGPENYVPYDTEEIVAYEVGFKATLAEGRVQLNSAVFFYDYSDLQTIISLPDATQPLTNADEATIAGLEADIMWRVNERFDVQLNVGYLDHELDDSTLDGAGNPSLGDKMPNTADLSYGGVLRYEVPVSDAWAVAFQTNFKWTDEMYRDAQNSEILKADSAWDIGANVSLMNEEDGWNISAWGKNLTDEETITFGFDSSGFSGNWGRSYNMPRTFGVSLTKRFN